jgi:parvulin-like peptidyl-prolyl isomerase
VASLRPDEISEVIPIGEEYYIVKLDARKPASIVPFDEVRSQIEQSLRKEEEDRLYKAWISRLRKRYHVMVFESGRGGSDSSGETISTF